MGLLSTASSRASLLRAFTSRYIWWRDDTVPSEDRVVAQVKACTPCGRKIMRRTKPKPNLKPNLKANSKPKLKTMPWDSAAYLKTDRDIAHYLEAVFEDGDPALAAAALGDVARAEGMSRIAKAAGLGRESLYKALSPDGNPELATVLKVMHALDLKLKVAVRA
jgi:probable addiction module antidote protein